MNSVVNFKLKTGSLVHGQKHGQICPLTIILYCPWEKKTTSIDKSLFSSIDFGYNVTWTLFQCRFSVEFINIVQRGKVLV